MALSCIISEMKRYIGQKSRFFRTPAFDAPVRGFPSEYSHTVWYGKIDWHGYPMVEKRFENMFTRFDTMHEPVRHQTDRRTERQTPHETTAQAALIHSMARQLISQVGVDQQNSFKCHEKNIDVLQNNYNANKPSCHRIWDAPPAIPRPSDWRWGKARYPHPLY